VSPLNQLQISVTAVLVLSKFSGTQEDSCSRVEQTFTSNKRIQESDHLLSATLESHWDNFLLKMHTIPDKITKGTQWDHHHYKRVSDL
jgi:hypothetical protein